MSGGGLETWSYDARLWHSSNIGDSHCSQFQGHGEKGSQMKWQKGQEIQRWPPGETQRRRATMAGIWANFQYTHRKFHIEVLILSGKALIHPPLALIILAICQPKDWSPRMALLYSLVHITIKFLFVVEWIRGSETRTTQGRIWWARHPGRAEPSLSEIDHQKIWGRSSITQIAHESGNSTEGDEALW
jgi:hypothetical protein